MRAIRKTQSYVEIPPCLRISVIKKSDKYLKGVKREKPLFTLGRVAN